MNRPCIDCGTLTARGTRCGECQHSHEAARYANPAWRAIPTPYGKRCALQLFGCTGWADTTDHIDGDATNHRPSNLQPACRHCNSKKGNK